MAEQSVFEFELTHISQARECANAAQQHTRAPHLDPAEEEEEEAASARLRRRGPLPSPPFFSATSCPLRPRPKLISKGSPPLLSLLLGLAIPPRRKVGTVPAKAGVAGTTKADGVEAWQRPAGRGRDRISKNSVAARQRWLVCRWLGRERDRMHRDSRIKVFTLHRKPCHNENRAAWGDRARLCE